MYSATPLEMNNMQLNKTSVIEFTGLNPNQSMAPNMFTATQNGAVTTRNAQKYHGSTGRVSPQLPSLNTTLQASARNTQRGQKFFFATKQPGESVGEQADPIAARRLKLNQVAQRD